MFRSGNKFLPAVIFMLLAGTVPLAAYYNLPDNQPPGLPSNYNQIAPSFFQGVPPLANLTPGEKDGYFVYYDGVADQWSVAAVITSGTNRFEQFHGSILVQLDSPPALGVNVWPAGFSLTEDLHRNDRWGWAKWPDSIASNLYEIWWDVTVDCENAGCGCTRTIGYWKTHAGFGPQANRISSLLTIWLGTPGGAKSLLINSNKIAVDVLAMKTYGAPSNGITKLYAQLLGAKLNIKSGADSREVSQVIADADAFLATHDWTDWTGLSSQEQEMVLSWQGTLDRYNNGLIGPEHCDDAMAPSECPPDSVCIMSISFSGCAFDFNIWGSSYNDLFDADRIYLGELMTPLAGVPGYSDTFAGIDDPYGHPFPGDPEPNRSVFGPVVFPGEAYNVNGLILSGSDYGNTYGGSRVYEGNGIQFSVNTCENNPPTFNPPIGYLKPMMLCLGSTIHDTIIAVDFNPGDVVTITKVSGPGDFVSTPGLPPVYGYFTWTPTASGNFVVIFEAADNHGAVVIDSLIYNISFNTPPVAAAEDTSAFICFRGDTICYTVPAFDAENDGLAFSLLSGLGTIDPTTGEICFMPPGGGEYKFSAEVSDTCGADTTTFSILVAANHDPKLEPVDSIVSICELDSICFDMTAFDPDIGDSLVLTLLHGPGVFVQTGNGVGRLCFLPDSLTDSRYVFYFRVTDECWRKALSEKMTPPPPPFDSAVIYVRWDRPPQISCPGDKTEHLCQADSLCYQIDAYDPEGDSVTYSIVSGPGVINPGSGRYCFYADQEGTFRANVAVTDRCGLSDTCGFNISVSFDRPPVLTVYDSTVFLCDLQEVCVPFSYSDPDGNVARVTIRLAESDKYDDAAALLKAPEGRWGGIFPHVSGALANSLGSIPFARPRGGDIVVDSSICFTPPAEGEYDFVIDVVDSCGNAVSDTATIIVGLNKKPSVAVGDTTVFLCEPTEVCVPVAISDPDNSISRVEVTPPASYDPERRVVCLPINDSGQYGFSVTVHDSCGASATDDAMVTAALNSSPVVTAPPDTTVFQCAPSEICLTGFTVADVDDNIVSVEFIPDIGTYFPAEGRYCFTQSRPGQYCLVIRAVDACGKSAEDTVCVTVELADNVVITCPNEVQTFSLCAPESVCVDIPVSPASATVTVVEPGAVYGDGKLCMYPTESGRYAFTVIAADECGADTCQVTIDITLGDPPQLTCPEPEPVFLCGPDSISVPLGVIPADADLTITPEAVYADGKLTFYAESAGDYCFQVIAATECGRDTCDFCVPVRFNSSPMVDVADTSLFLCEIKEICIPIHYSDPDGNIARVIIQPVGSEMYADVARIVPPSVDVKSLGNNPVGHPGKPVSSLDTAICFTPTGAGEYDYVVIVVDSCGESALDTVAITVDLNKNPSVSVGDTSVFLCEPTEVCVPVVINDADANISRVEVSDPAWYNSENNTICLPPVESGNYVVTVTAYDECGATAADTAAISITTNSWPTVTLPDDTVMSLCERREICIPVIYADPDGNLANVFVYPPEYAIEDGSICFTPSGSGRFDFIVTPTDACGAVDADTIRIDVTIGEAPQLTCPPSEAVHICGPDSISVPLGVIPASSAVTIAPPAHYADGMVKFYAAESGQYCFEVIATSDCGSDTCNFCITVTVDSPPVVTVADSSLFLCKYQEICLPYHFSDPDNNVASVTISTLKRSFDTHETDGVVCFTPTYAGKHEFVLTVTDSCGLSASDTGTVYITFNQVPSVYLPNKTFFICGPGEICLPITASDPDGTIDSIVVMPPALYDAINRKACLTVSESGVYAIMATAYDNCGAADSYIGRARVIINSAPVVTVPADTAVFQCEPSEICLSGFTFFDRDNNLDAVSFEPDLGVFQDGRYCFMPDEPGEYCFVVRAFDSCGAVGQDTVCVTYERGETVVITCPETQVVDLCHPDSVCVDIPVSPASAELRVLEPGAVYDNGRLCFYAAESGNYTYTVVADDDCGTDTCRVMFDVTVDQVPVISCPPDFDVHLCKSDSISFHIPITPAWADVTVSPEASYADGNLSFYASEPREYCFSIAAKTTCGVDTCDVCVTVTFDSPPVVTISDSTVFLCTPQEICVPFSYSDPDGNIARVIVQPIGYKSLDSVICFTPPSSGVYTVIVTVVDSCANVTADTAHITVDINENPFVSIRDTTVFLCDSADICLPVTISDPEGRIESVVVSEPAHYNTQNQTICLSAGQSGEYPVIITVYDDCGASDVDTGKVKVIINAPPVVSLAADTAVVLCEPAPICIPVAYSDPDDNIVDVRVEPAEYEIVDGQICFTPQSGGDYRFIVSVTDACAVTVADTILVSVSLNLSPQVAIGDSALFVCEPTTVCLPVQLSDPDGRIDSVKVSAPAYYNAENRTVCMAVSDAGSYQITVTVYDDCGVAATDIGVLSVTFNSSPTVILPEDTSLAFCGPQEVCIPVQYGDVDGNIVSIDVAPSGFELVDGSICFTPEAAGTYGFSVTVTDACGVKAADNIEIQILLNEPPAVAVNDSTVFLCEPADICLPVTMSDPDGVIDSVVVSPGVYYDPIKGVVCLPVVELGVYTITITVYDDCGASVSDDAQLTVTLNRPPTVDAPADTTIFLCEPGEICLDRFEIADDDGNIDKIQFIPNLGTYADGRYCFTPVEPGEYCFIIRVTDKCGAVAEDTVCVTYLLGEEVVISCPPEPVAVSLCNPETICVGIPITPAGAEVHVQESGAVYEDGKLCFYADHAGTYTYTIIATGDCGADTCLVTFNVSLDSAPQVTCPPSDSIHICDPGPVSVPVGVSPSTAIVTINPPAAYADGRLTFQVDEPGQFCFTVIASNSCGADTCSFCYMVTIDSPPVAEIADTSAFLCVPQEICLPYSYSDPDNNVVSVTVSSKRYELTEGFVCFTPTGPGTEEIVLIVTDSCGHSAVDTATVVVMFNQPPVVSVRDSALFICGPTEVCLPVSVTDPDGWITSIIATSPARYDAENHVVCLPVSATGAYEVQVTAYDSCGSSASDKGVIVATLNHAPIVTAPADTSVVQCTPTVVCLQGIGIADLDNNISRIEFDPAIGTYTDHQYCFLPDTAGTYCIVIRAIDACGAVGEDTACITVQWGEDIMITCPTEVINDTICAPDTICVDLPIQPAGARIRIIEAGGYYRDGQLCFFASESGMYSYTVIASTDCDADTCQIAVNVTREKLPVIACPEVAPKHLCGPDSIFIPITVDPATAEMSVTPPAVLAGGFVRFFADHEGQYCFDVIARTVCGSDTCHICVPVSFDKPPVVVVRDTAISLCRLEEVCVPISYSDPDNNIKTIDVQPVGFRLVGSQVCFTPAVAGLQTYSVTVTDSCGFVTADTGAITVTLNQAPTVSVGDTTLFLCGTFDVCVPITMSDPDGIIDTVIIFSPAYYDAEHHRVCLPVSQAGTYKIIATVIDDCGASDVDTGIVSATFNQPPIVNFGAYPNPMRLCDLAQVCVPFTVTDPNANITKVEGSASCGSAIVRNQNGYTLCWTPVGYGPCTLRVIVTDVCGAADTAVAQIELVPGTHPDPPCRRDTTVSICSPGQVCLPIDPIQPGSHITVRPGAFQLNPSIPAICYTASSTRVDTVTVIDSTECGKDSCRFIVRTNINRPPVITGETPAEVVFCHSAQVCVNYTINDPDNNIDTVLVKGNCPGAVLDALHNRVCLNITDELHCSLSIIVVDDCGLADTLTVPINARPNLPPQIILPDLETVVRCEDDTSTLVVADICITDPDYGSVNLILDSGAAQFDFNPSTNCGALKFKPSTNDTAQYCFRFLGTDNCDTVIARYCLNVLPAVVCSTCVNVYIDDPGCVNSGGLATLYIRSDATNDIAAFDLLIGYDASALTFLRAEIGSAIEGWEYFTYRFGDLGNCQAPCPSGLLRVVSIADINNGPFHPPADQLNPDGILATLLFRASPDLNLGGQSIPVNFFWMDCGDNGFSDPTGQYLFVDQAIYSPEGNIIWDEFNDAAYPERSRPPHVGTPDSCLKGGEKFQPTRCITYHNGKVCITHPDSIDARGDMNLNGVAYEIADAVVYTNYFIIGLKAFTISQAGQIAASDVNADGMTLSIADLVYIVRILIGDAPPYPKERLENNIVSAACIQKDDEAKVSIASDYDVGAVLMVFNYTGVQPGDPQLAEGARTMDMKFGWVNGELRVLLYSFKAGVKIPAGLSNLITIPTPDGGEVRLTEMELADYYGRVLEARVSTTILPEKLELTQNHPNPFNPTTSFELALPVSSDYIVTVYNVAGQLIRQWSGYAEAGYVTFEWDGRDESGNPVASGIYFYRAKAAGAEAIRKMVLLK